MGIGDWAQSPFNSFYLFNYKKILYNYIIYIIFLFKEFDIINN